MITEARVTKTNYSQTFLAVVSRQREREKEGEQHPADRKTKEQRQKEAKTEGWTVTGREGRSVEIPN